MPRTSPGGRTLARATSALVLAAGLVASSLAAPAGAVNRDHGNRIVSALPAATTPYVVDGAVLSFVQVGSRMVAAGTFTAVRQTPTGPDMPRSGIFAFDALTGTIDPTFDPQLGGAAGSLDTDGSSVFVGGDFTSVDGDPSVRYLARLSAAGTLLPGLQVPDGPVNEVVVRGSRLFLGGKFTRVGSTPRNAFAALDTGTGAVRPDVAVPFTGTYNGGRSGIVRMDVDPAGTTVVAVGNFTSVGGQPRAQVAVVSTPTAGTATVSSWSTERFTVARNATCAQVFDTFTRDVDVSPDGRYFVMTTTGSFGGGSASGAMCDTTSRWELGRTGGGQEPSWVTYTGGDTSYGVAITGGVVYTGGHFRWQNNPFQGDQAGPGAVPREGVAALDPVNGMPLSWNPGRTRGVGAQAMYATSEGLWVGSDTDRFAGYLRGRIAFLPLAGGTVLPTFRDATLPGNLFLAPRTPRVSGGYRYRLNVGGGALQAGDAYTDWTGEGSLASGGGVVTSSTLPVPDATVPTTVPRQLFSSQRYGAQRYALPVRAGTRVTVRLYFANTSTSTALPGQQTFDVRLDGRLVLDDFDVVVAAGGTQRGTMRQFDVLSDGRVDVDLAAVRGNPILSGLEVRSALAQKTPAPLPLRRRPLDAAGTPTAAAVPTSTAMDFSRVRGATLVGRTLYYGLADGALHARSFDPATGQVGPERQVDLRDDPEDGRRIPFPVANLTGLAFDADTRRLYYTLYGDSRLYYRYFSAEAEIVGAQTFVAPTGTLTWSSTAGMTVAGDRLLYGSSDGRLRAVSLVGGQVSGTPAVLSSDGSWNTRGFFVAPPA